MKVKRVLSVILCLALLCALLIGCAKAEEVSREVTAVEHIDPYDAYETEYQYRYDWLNGGFKMVPVMQLVHHAEEYRVQYLIVYSNGREKTQWITVSEADYIEAAAMLGAE